MRDRSDLSWTRLDRRSFLALSAAAALAACSDDDAGDAQRSTTESPGPTTTTGAVTTTVVERTPPVTLPPVPELAVDPFGLGVASGDPDAQGFVLWTRLTQDPLNGGGMPAVDVPVRWIVAADDSATDVVREGYVVVGGDLAHTVNLVVDGLEPDRVYWYRFEVGPWQSEIGRTRTFPAPGTMPDQLRFAFASCQNYRMGFYAAWGDVVAQDVDLVVFLGDYIYETGLAGPARSHLIEELLTLDDYRNQYALYRSDPQLRAAHAAAPWLITWDDHEVDNNYQGVVPETRSVVTDPQAFLDRRAAAYRAWWEHTPTRLPPPDGPDLAIYRHADFGDLARFFVLDTRQYRSDQPCAEGSDIAVLCAEASAADVTVLGAEQEAWLDAGLAASAATWNVLANQVVFSQLAFSPDPTAPRNLDQWDGYPAARTRVLETLMATGASNPVVITGDIHSSWVSDVLADFDDPSSARLGTELIGTSISSEAPDALAIAAQLALGVNAHVKWADTKKRGWVHCTVTPDEWRADYRFVDDVLVADSPVTVGKSWVIPVGSGVREA